MDNIQVEKINIGNDEYIILDKIPRDGLTYYYLSNINDPKDIMVNKVLDGSDVATNLDSDEEIKEAMSLYLSKNA